MSRGSRAGQPLAAFLADLSSVLARPTERAAGLARLCAALGALADADALLCLAQADDVLRCETGTGGLAALEGDVLPLEGSLEGDAFRAGTALTTPNLRADARAWLAVARDLPNTPAVAIPLLAEGGAEGVALLARRSREPEFSDAEVDGIRLAATLVAAALRNFAQVERVRASRAVVEAMRSARGRDGELTRSLLRAVRHELNTPVAVIQGNLQLCPSADPAEWKVPASELWQAVRAEAERLEALSRRLRALEEDGEPVVFDSRGRFVSPHHPNGDGTASTE